jgi:serine/threonine protein kinase
LIVFFEKEILCSFAVFFRSENSAAVRVQMMHQLALRLRDLHEFGVVHRDLKPGNVMWLPRENRWTVIDFGCAARTGERARLCFSLAYAAPEAQVLVLFHVSCMRVMYAVCMLRGLHTLA